MPSQQTGPPSFWTWIYKWWWLICSQKSCSATFCMHVIEQHKFHSQNDIRQHKTTGLQGSNQLLTFHHQSTNMNTGKFTFLQMTQTCLCVIQMAIIEYTDSPGVILMCCCRHSANMLIVRRLSWEIAGINTTIDDDMSYKMSSVDLNHWVDVCTVWKAFPLQSACLTCAAYRTNPFSDLSKT